MKPLFTNQELINAKSTDKLPCQCYKCENTFYKQKKIILLVLKKHKDVNGKNYSNFGKYCSTKCKIENQNTQTKVICKNCNNVFSKIPAEISDNKNNFCSRSCSTIYNNTHKTTGTRRSKIELYFEEQLTSIYPNIDFHFNRRDTINSELDIYIPSLKLAFELNGIFHYEPIFGPEKLSQIQNNDQRKFQACVEKNISFCTIDISSITYVKPEKMQKFVNIALDIINNHIKDNNSKNDNI